MQYGLVKKNVKTLKRLMVKKNLKTLILQTAFRNYKNEVGLTPGYKNKGHWSDMRTPVAMLCSLFRRMHGHETLSQGRCRTMLSVSLIIKCES